MTSASSGTQPRSSTAALAEKAKADAPAGIVAPPELQAVKPFKPEPVTPDRMKDAEASRQTKVINCDQGTTVDHLMDPIYWSHIASVLRPRTRIEAWAHDETWMAELIVLDCGRLYARVKLLHFHNLTEGISAKVDENVDSPYFAKWMGDQGQWGVVRREDMALMIDGIQGRDAAMIQANQMSRSHTKK
jgi:hypothetical protein